MSTFSKQKQDRIGNTVCEVVSVVSCKFCDVPYISICHIVFVLEASVKGMSCCSSWRRVGGEVNKTSLKRQHPWQEETGAEGSRLQGERKKEYTRPE